MRRYAWLAAFLVWALALPAFAAPLFPDVPEQHWARDAVASLAARGLVEGYPDGTFKGDRAASRWEVAMIVARLLAKMEQTHATFATKSELEELRKLVNALRDELDALGVRVSNLEENVSRLDKRVTELERITFYGQVEARAAFQSFRNTGQPDNSLGSGAPGTINYNNAVGSLLGTQFSPWQNQPGVFIDVGAHAGSSGSKIVGPAGVLPVMDFTNGRALTNGTGFTALGLLGLRVRVSDDIDAGAEFVAYTSQGDRIIDALWGASAPFLSNPYAANTFAGGAFAATAQPLNNAPYTRMTLDNFWLVHNPSKTKVVLGAFSEDEIDDFLYTGAYNPNAFGPEFLDSFGINVSGETGVGDGVLRWEALGSRLPDGNQANANGRALVGAGTNYQNYVAGADLAYEFDGGSVKLNFLRVANEAPSGAVLLTGLVNNVNVAYGHGVVSAPPAGTTSITGVMMGATPLQWVNTPGFYVGQLSAAQRSGAGTTGDVRPIPGWNVNSDHAGVPGSAIGPNLAPIAGAGGFGPQGQTGYGISGNYKWDIAEGSAQIYFLGEYGHTEYKPNKNSVYEVGGDAYKVEVGANLMEGDLDLSLGYIGVDPTYDPFILQYDTAFTGAGTYPGVWRLPDMDYFPNLYSLHDTKEYPHNRRGFRFNGQYRFDGRRGLVFARAGFLEQTDTSLYGVRVPFGSIANTGGVITPNFTVIGHVPGFIDPVFFGYAHPSIYGPQSANAFTAALAPLEDPRGRATNWTVGYTYKFDNPRLKLDVALGQQMFHRDSTLRGNLGGEQNYVDLEVTNGHFGLGWEADDQWTVMGGMDLTNIRGHWDPSGLYTQFAGNTPPTFDTINSTQTTPFLGFDYDVSANTQWGLDLRYIWTRDNVDPNIAAGRRNTLNPNAGMTAHNFDWQGYQITTRFSVKF